MIDFDLVLNSNINPTNDSCYGLIYRGYTSAYRTKCGFETVTGLRLLKRKSCLCGKCSWMDDMLGEFINADMLILPIIENGKYYSCYPSDFSTEWETGMGEFNSITFYEVDLDD